jgi:hypothetical protein
VWACRHSSNRFPPSKQPPRQRTTLEDERIGYEMIRDDKYEPALNAERAVIGDAQVGADGYAVDAPTRAPIVHGAMRRGEDGADQGRYTPTEEEEEDVFDPTAAVAGEARRLRQATLIEALVDSLLPAGSPSEAREKLLAHFRATPINNCIGHQRVVITHTQNESGEEVRMRLPEMTLEDALEQARDNNLDLVQVAEKAADGIAYCRLRNEQVKALSLVSDLVPSASGASAAAQAAGAAGAADGSDPAQQQQQAQAEQLQGGRTPPQREPKSHVFRDAVDQHFVDWRSRKIVEELHRGHPVTLQIQQFISPESAIGKMKEMMDAVKAHAEKDEKFAAGLTQRDRGLVSHRYTGVRVSDKELAVTLVPDRKTSGLKHPGPADWAAAQKRFIELCRKSDRKSAGTYQESSSLKRRDVGARTFRTDKFGRRLE